MPIQTHLVVVHNEEDNSYKAIGILTSEKTNNIKVSNTQQFSGSDKAQYVKRLIPPIIVKLEYFEEHKIATQIINYPAISDALDEVKLNSEKYKAVVYTSYSVIQEDLKDMLEVKSLINEPISLPEKIVTKEEELKLQKQQQKGEHNIKNFLNNFYFIVIFNIIRLTCINLIYVDTLY